MIKCSNCTQDSIPTVLKMNSDPPNMPNMTPMPRMAPTPNVSSADEMPNLVKQIPYDRMIQNYNDNNVTIPKYIANETGVPEANVPSASELFRNAPVFAVPTNPLLPEGYQEMLSYNELQYLNGFIRTQIGKMAQVDFLIGSNTMVTKTGILIAVGINFIILKEAETGAALTCDYYTIKFITFY